MEDPKNITIDTGELSLMINNDPSRVITFNPFDTVFAENFYRVMSRMEAALVEVKIKATVLEADKRTQENGLPVNAPEYIIMMQEVAREMRKDIDELFGEGTSEKAFGKVLNIEVYSQLFDQVTPYIRDARNKVTEKYTKPSRPDFQSDKRKRSKRAVKSGKRTVKK